MSFRLALSKRDFNHYFKKVQLTSDSQLTFAWSPSSRRVVGRSVRCRPGRSVVVTGFVMGKYAVLGGGGGRRLLVNFMPFW